MELIRYYFELGVVGVVSAMFTTFLARKRFVSERWWDRKADAYTHILDALVSMHRYHEAYYDDLTHESELSDERKAELTAEWKVAWRQVDNAIRLGAFVVCEDAHAALSRLRAATRGVHPHDFFGLVDAEYAATTKCIGEIREIGRTDLRVGSGRVAALIRRAMAALRREKAIEATVS